ncbi:MAG: PilZ domain-containing protein [Elusimicrobiota bacterium]
MPKRKLTRVPVIILLDLHPADTMINKGRGCIVNLSLGGMAVESEAEFDKGDELFIVVNLPGAKKPVEFYADVLHKEKMGNVNHYGLKYVKMKFLQKLRMRHFIHDWIKKQQSSAGTPAI